MGSQGSIWIVARTNQAGLDQDVALVTAALEQAGWEAVFRHCRSLGWLERFRPRRGPNVLICIERAFPAWRRMSPVNILIPNQERFPRRQLGRLRHVDHVFCKSRHALKVFSSFHRSARYLGFTSPDRGLDGVKKDFNRFLHVAGRSTAKGTETVLEIWNRHPEWPVLELVQCRERAPGTVPTNVHLHSGRLDDRELGELQNACGIHLCPSRCEGWGHYIVEAMSCSAVVITTDAPPMNELVTADRGVVVPWHRKQPRHLGEEFLVERGALERAIATLLTQSDESKQRAGRAARLWFEENDRAFRARLVALMGELQPPPRFIDRAVAAPTTART